MKSATQPSSRRRVRTVLAAAAAAAGLLAATVPTAVLANGSEFERNSSVVVANRGSGDISVIDITTLNVENIDLPGVAEPMYVSHDFRNDRVLVGDRASSEIVALDDETYEVVGTVDVGDGVFHQWLDVNKRQLWVVGDTSGTVTVVNNRTLEVITTIDIPADLIEAGGKPHDVFVSGRNAFVSILGVGGTQGVVLQYSTKTFTETGRVMVGNDPHLFVDGGRLFVASQDGSTVSSYRANSLAPIESFDVPSAHGIFVQDGRVLATNIAGGGTDAVYELNRDLTRVRDTVDTGAPVPHNLTVDNRRHAYVTHSGGTADQVSVIDLRRNGFGSTTMVTAGLNPFGLAFVKA